MSILHATGPIGPMSPEDRDASETRGVEPILDLAICAILAVTVVGLLLQAL